MTERSPDAMLLIHGTFAHSDEDRFTPGDDPIDEAGRARWWQDGSDFARDLDALLAGEARCWPADVCAVMPWAHRSLGHRLEMWTILGRRPFAWFRPRVRITSRRLFAWSGMNSDAERRKAGRRLYQGLRRLEAMERPYHLIGHSHGGTVIWHALHLAARRGQELPGMRSWTTLGTPFPTYGPIRFRWLVGLLGLALIGLVAHQTLGGDFVELPRPLTWKTAWATVWALLWWESPANLYPRGLSVATAGFLTILLGLAVWFALTTALWVFRSIEHRAERLASERAWRSFGGRWLGLFSEIDEAIAGTQNSVGLYVERVVRLPWPAPSRVVKFLLLVVATFVALFVAVVHDVGRVGLSQYSLAAALLLGVILLVGFVNLASALAMNWVVLPLAEWVTSLLLRMKFQGARAGTCLMLTSPEPFSRRSFPDEPTRGPLPKELAEPLHAMAREKVRGRMATVRAQFAADARSSRTPKALLREYFSGLKLTNELVHSSYYDVAALRRAIAYHVRKSARGTAPDDLAGDLEGVVAWLDGARPAPPPRDYLPKRKPPITTPVWTRLILAASVLLVSYLAFQGLRFDVGEVFAARIAAHAVQVGDPSNLSLSYGPMPEPGGDANEERRSQARQIDLAMKVFRPACALQLGRLATDTTESRRVALIYLMDALSEPGEEGTPTRLGGPGAADFRRQTVEQLLNLAIFDKVEEIRSTALKVLFIAVQDERYAQPTLALIRSKVSYGNVVTPAEIATLTMMGARGADTLAEIVAKPHMVVQEPDFSASGRYLPHAYLGEAGPWAKRALGVLTAVTRIPLERLAPGLDATAHEVRDAAEEAINSLTRDGYGDRPLIHLLYTWSDPAKRVVSLVRPRAVPKPDRTGSTR
jgi:hypothetical protein